ncbi:MAG: hypothetical protein R3352_09535 [Salinisphaeraceae bacterium]|nr:hypothetical protein [Salinisphaeraceae bacterium]
MLKALMILIGLSSSLPAWAVDYWTCLEDGQEIELSGVTNLQRVGESYVWVLLTDNAYCHTQYDMDTADFAITSTNVMRFQLDSDNPTLTLPSDDSNRKGRFYGKVYKVSGPGYVTPLVIMVERFELD